MRYKHRQRDSKMNNLMTRANSLSNRYLTRKVSFRIHQHFVVIAFLLSPTATHAQSYKDPLGQYAAPGSQGVVSLGDQTYRVVSAEDYSQKSKPATAPIQSAVSQASNIQTSADAKRFEQAFISSDETTSNSVAQVSCQSCEPTRPDSMKAKLAKACNSCGAAGGAYGCIKCDSYFYAIAEAIHVDRDNEDTATISSRYGLSGFEREMGTRITVGRVPNCVNGWEGSFTGIINWNSRGSLEAPIFRIQSNLEPIAPVSANDISAFNDAFIQTVNYDARYWSAELNRTYVGWEVAKMICGVRYIDFEEQYDVYSENDTESGTIDSDIDNQLIGLQVGMDLTYPILQKTYVDFRGRAGIYANFLDLDLAVINDNEWAAGINDRSVDLAGQFELAIGLRYEVTQKLSLKCGAELWYLSGIGTSYDQLNNGIMGRDSVEGYEELITSALTYGAELRF